jgi:hypothetical protein
MVSQTTLHDEECTMGRVTFRFSYSKNRKERENVLKGVRRKKEKQNLAIS